MFWRSFVVSALILVAGGITLYVQQRMSIRPGLSGCDQTATTVDCAFISRESSTSSRMFQSSATTTVMVSNFSLEIPENAFMSEFGWEGVPTPGNYQIDELDAEGHSVYIFTKPAPLSSVNPNAASLSDYEKDYPISASSTHPVYINGKTTAIEVRRQVRILSTESLIMHGVPMLRQRYSIGIWSFDSNGEKIFDASDESSVDNWLRYVFFDGKSFVIITGWQDDYWIDFVTKSIRIKP